MQFQFYQTLMLIKRNISELYFRITAEQYVSIVIVLMS